MDTHEAFVRTPLSILHDNNLSDAAFRLYLEIFGLSEASKKGYCWATNRTLAENFGKSPRSVIRALSELEEKGYIRKEETRNELTKQVTERRIYPLKKSSPPTKKKSRPIKENVTPLVTEIADPSPQNCHTPDEESVTLPVSKASHSSTQNCHSPYDENGTENICNSIEHTIKQTIEQSIKQTSEQSIDTNNNGVSSEEIFQKDFEDFWNEYPLKFYKINAYKAYIARILDGEDKENLLTAASRYASECKDLGREKKYIMFASTFLGENRRYEDYLDRNQERWFSNKPKCRIVVEDDDLPF